MSDGDTIADIVIYSEDVLSAEALKFAFDSKGCVTHLYDDLKNCLRHIIVTPPDLIILDEIKTGPSHGNIVSGIRKKLKDFSKAFLFILDRPETSGSIEGFNPTIDGYIQRPYTLNALLELAFLLMKLELPQSEGDTGSTSAFPFDDTDRDEQIGDEQSTANDKPSKWLDDLMPLSPQQDHVNLIGDEAMLSSMEVPEVVNSDEKAESNSDSSFKAYKGTILVVDDEPFIIRIIKTILESADYRVLTADNGLEAMKKCQEIIPDLILLDLMMPEIDGYEFTQIIRAEKGFDKIPIVILSARPLTQDQGKAFKLGVNFYMQKPIERDKLLNIINNLIHEM